jgi:small subunit ribosomal protein S16
MAVMLRLARRGAKKAPFYHVVATDSRHPRDGKFTEEVGTYDPGPNPPKVNLKQDRIEHWLKMGAQPSPTVARLIKLSKKQPGQPARQPGQSTLR